MAQRRQSPAPNGVYAALATPRQANSVDADAAAFLDYVDLVVRAGVQGLVLFGAMGEFVHFSLEERMRALALAIRRSRVPVLVNVSHSTLDGAMAVAEHAIGVGAAGLLLMPPYFYHYTDNQLFAYFRAFAEFARDDVPLYLYNLPSSTTPISLPVAESLLSSGEYKGIDDASDDPELFASLAELKKSVDFTLLAGDERIYLGALQAGADGMVSGIAAAIPELPLGIYNAQRKGDQARAEFLYGELQSFAKWTERLPPLAAIQRAGLLRGWPLTGTTLPPDPQTCADLDSFNDWFRQWWPPVLSECTGKGVSGR